MDNQTDPASAGAPTPAAPPAPTYGADPASTYSRSDDINPQKGYGGPNNIGSTGQSFAALGSAIGNAGSVIAKGAPQIGEDEAAPGQAATANPVAGSNLWQNFTDGLKNSDSANETDLRQFSLQDSVDQARENIKKTAGVDIPNPYVGAFAASPTAMQDYQNSLQDLLAKHQEDTPEDKAIRDAVQPALDMNTYADQWVKDAQSKSQMDLAKSSGTLLPWLAQQAGQMAGSFRNPINALGLMVGGPELGAAGPIGRILQEGVSQAAIQMGLTGFQEPGHQARAAQLGEEHGFWPVMHDLEDSALGGFVGGSAIRSLHEIGALFRPADQGVATEEFLRRAQDIPPPGGWPEGSESRGQAWRREMDEWAAQQAKGQGAVVPFEDQGMGYPAEGVAPAPSPGQPEGVPGGGTVAFKTPLPKEVLPPKLETPPAIANLPKTTEVSPTAIEARQNDVIAAPPTLPPGLTKGDALEAYSGTVKAGENPDTVAKPLMPPATPDALPATDPKSLALPKVDDVKPGATFIKDDKPVTREDFDPTKLTTNADVFQYKGGGNAQGVTDRLKGVGQWDPIAGSDPMVVFKWNDGREDVVNGHQRTGLARALDAQGSLPEGTRTPGFVFKEADGWTPTDVRAYAAKVNLMQGSGDVLDSARILRDRPDIWDKSLPTSEPKLKQAKGLAELSDDGWGMVVNGHVKPDLAALVGQGLPDKSTHSSMLQSIIDFKGADQNSVRMMIADANAAGFYSEDQADIFGSAPITKNLLQERAAVYSRVVTALRDNKRIFGMLDREADRIEDAGNVLAGDANAQQADRAAQLSAILEKLAVRQGPVSAALNRAAQTVAQKTSPAVAARTFLNDIDRLIREEGLKLSVPPQIRPRDDIDVSTIPGQEQATEELRQSTAALSDDMFGSQTKTIPEQRQAIFDDMTRKLMDADMPRVQAEANAAVMAARYVARASRLGRTDPETLYREQGLTVRGDRQRASGEEPAKEGAKVLNQPATVPTFYSSVQRAVDNAKLNKASPEQWLATLKNLPAVKPEEVKWLGLEDWLKGQKGPVTKDDVAAYVRANQIQVNEINKDGAREVGQMTRYPGYVLPGGENYREMLLTLPMEGKDLAAARDKHMAYDDILNTRGLTPEEQEDYDQNLQHLMTAPNPHLNPEKAGAYKSSHWEEPNVLAHIRFDDREISGGRALHLAEVQSDWHQGGRRHGYVSGDIDTGALSQAVDVAREEFNAIRSAAPEPTVLRMAEAIARKDAAAERLRSAQVALNEAQVRAAHNIPEAPFKTTWPELSMKRMIRYAAENGYDRITWDTGKTNAERYDLSKQVDRVSYAPETQHLRAFKNGDVVVRKVVPPEKLADEIGKDAAEKLLQQPLQAEKATGATNFRSENVHVIEGEDLKVGGSGMEGFYDKMLPAAVDKLTKKFGGKTEWAKIARNDPYNMKYEGPDRNPNWVRSLGRLGTEGARLQLQANTVARAMETGLTFSEAIEKEGSPALAELAGGQMIAPEVMTPVHSLTLTPELKEAALNEGFPLFAKASEDDVRGRITMRDDSAVVDLFKKKNASTFMHEAGHKFLEEMAQDAGAPNAPKQIKDDFKTVLDWLGAKDAESIGTDQHEKFARGFEQYLREGKAPSEGLRRAFDQFKEWLRSIYRSLVGLGKEIPDAIRGVMDRMIATDDEIAAERATERGPAREAPPTQKEAAAAQADALVHQVAGEIDGALQADGTPLARELSDMLRKEVNAPPPAPEPGAKPEPPREPIPFKGTKLDKTVDLRAAGLRPKGRGDGASSTSAAQVAWATAKQTGKTEIAGIGVHGWKVLRPTEGLAYGQPHVEVTPDGVARFYGSDIGETGTKEEQDAARKAKFESMVAEGRAERAKASALIDEAIAKPNPSLILERGDDKLVLSRGLGDYPLRITTLDKDGPVGHRDYNETDREGVYSMDSEVVSALREGFKVRGPTERTAAGEQGVMPGVKPVTDADRAQAGAEKPLRGGDAAPPAGGLFDDDAKNQVDWLDMVPTGDGYESASELKESLRPQTPEEKTFFQSVKTPADLARERYQKALALRAQQKLVGFFQTHRTIDGRRDVGNAIYSTFEDMGDSGFPSVRFLAESMVARHNAMIADALEHFKRKTFYSDGSLIGARRNRTDFIELRRAMMGEKADPEMQKLASGIHAMLSDGLKLFNEQTGGTVGELKNWTPQSHNPSAVYRAGGAKTAVAGKANWTKYIGPLLDWEKMRDPVTGVLMGNTTPAQRQAILEYSWGNIVTDGNLRGKPGEHRLQPTSIANSRSDHRFYIFKDADSQAAYDKNYGDGDLVSQILTHMRMLDRDTALMKIFGPNPASMIGWAKQVVTQEMAKVSDGQPSLFEGYDKLSAKERTAKANKINRTIDGYYAQFRGDNYDQGKIALIGTILRNVETSALLGKSIIPHAVANPFIQMTARYYGGVPIFQSVPQLIAAFRTASKEEMLRSGLDVEQGAYSLGESARYITTLERVANATRWLPDRVTALSGLHPFVEASRGAYRRGAVANLADMQQTAFNDLPPKTLAKLKGYGITEAKWRILQAATPYKPALRSAPWLRPLDIENVGTQGVQGALGNPDITQPQAERMARDTAIDFGAYIQGETEVAVPTNSIRMRASLVGDSDPNTLWGQLRRSATMFKGFIASFMMTQLRANARIAAGHQPSTMNPKFGNRRFSLKHAAFMVTAMTVLGVVAFILKNMSAGKEIPSLDPTTPEGRKTWEHGALTGGAFGYLGDFLASQESSYGRGPLETLAGPVGAAAIGAGGQAWDAFTSATTKRPSHSKTTAEERAIENTMFAIRNNTPLGNLWWGQAAFQRMVLDQLQQAVDPNAHATFATAVKRLQQNSNQKFWWKPGEITPHEYPWQHSK